MAYFFLSWHTITTALADRQLGRSCMIRQRLALHPISRVRSSHNPKLRSRDHIERVPPLVQLHAEKLSHLLQYAQKHRRDGNKNDKNCTGYVQSPSSGCSITLTIHGPAGTGGHALLGPNGTGKSTVVKCIVAASQQLQQQPQTESDDGFFFHRSSVLSVQHVSMESHLDLLRLGGTVHKALSQHGNLNQAAQFLVVRFGLFPLLHQDVRTLSNGQIKKLLIVRALSLRPTLLILDNAFDGLDVPSRDILKQIVSKTIQGFHRHKILVQAVSAKSTVHSQILLLTQRAEEIVDEIGTISYFTGQDEKQRLMTIDREGRSAEEILQMAVCGDKLFSACDIEQSTEWSLPTLESIQLWWQPTSHAQASPSSLLPVVQIRDLFVQRNNKILLHNLSWTVQRGERWLVGGLNGAGKSTLSRLLKNSKVHDEGIVAGVIDVIIDGDANRIGWVSTELHISLAHKTNLIVKELMINGDTPNDSAIQILKWLGLDGTVLARPFAELSQGEQRLILIASALVIQPVLLVFDEVCQGLDLLARRRVLSLVERICQATNVTLIYITHHLEELIPSVSKVLHLKHGQAIFEDTVTDYKPEELEQREKLE